MVILVKNMKKKMFSTASYKKRLLMKSADNDCGKKNKENIHCATEKPRLVKICGHRCVDICWTHAYMHIYYTIVHALKTWPRLGCALRSGSSSSAASACGPPA